MIKILLRVCCLFFSLQLLGGPSLAFVHLGEKLPQHLQHSLAQARLFNPDCSIYLIASASALRSLDNMPASAIPIAIESLNISSAHKAFISKTRAEAFWRFAMERFLVLDDFIQQNNLSNVFHIENDVMLYFNLKERLSVFEECYPDMLATVFDCDERSVPSFVYLANPSVSKMLAEFIADRADWNTTDMELLSLFKDRYYKTRADHLPILIPSYANDYPLTSIFKKTAKSATPFYASLDRLGLIFDAAALGQFLGGIDPILGQSRAGFLGEASVFLPMFFQFRWVQDTQKRWIPHIRYGKEEYPIANLHIHCKNLAPFGSLEPLPPEVPKEFFSSLPFEHIQRKL